MASYQAITTTALIDWDNPASWAGGMVPDDADAAVTLPTIVVDYIASESAPVRVAVQSGESFVAGSISGGGEPVIAGTLTVAGADTTNVALDGGTLDTASLDGSVTGYGTLDVTGALAIPHIGSISGELAIPELGLLESSGGALNVTLGSLDNEGGLVANGSALTVTITPGGFQQQAGYTLEPSGQPYSIPDYTPAASGLTQAPDIYQAEAGGTLAIDAGQVIANDGAVTVLGTGSEASGVVDTIESYDPASGQYETLQQTLQSVGGELAIEGTQSFAAINPLTISGVVALDDGGLFSAPGLTLLPGATFYGVGTLESSVADNGTIIADDLVIDGPVTGSGVIEDDTGYVAELNGAASAAVLLNGGTLQLDQPGTFTGPIVIPQSKLYTTVRSSQVILAGITAASVTGTSFTPTANGGTLTVQEGAAQQTLYFTGLAATSFALAAEPGNPANLDITVTPPPVAPTLNAPARVVTNSGSYTVTGTAEPGTALSVSAGGTPASSITVGSESIYNATVAPPLNPGAQTVTVTATDSDAAGAASTSAASSVYLLPAPVNGVTTANVSSGDLAPATLSFTSATQEVVLTNGTLWLGPQTTGFIVNELYSVLLNRAADPGGLGNFTAQIADGTSLATVAQALINSPEGTYYQDATVAAPTFITHMFDSFLDRPPTATDLANYEELLNNGVSRGQVVAIIATSAEAANWRATLVSLYPNGYNNIWGLDPNGSLVTQLYQTDFGRDPDPSALVADTQALTAGLTPAALAQVLASSAEFQTDHNGQSPGAFVTQLYANALGRAPAASELQGWVGQIQAGATPAAITLAIATSAEATAHLSPVL